MNKRRYGSTGMTVSEIGFGAWQLGNRQEWEAMDETSAISLVHEALAMGINFFDTAPNYGLGNSETLLGKALKGQREKAVINTKFGHHAGGETDFGVRRIRESVEGSLKRLQTDYIDSVIIHNPPFELLDGKFGHYAEFEKLKAEGKIGAYGVSVDSAREMREAVTGGGGTGIGVIEVMFNIFYQETADAFALAQERDIPLIIKVPLDSGWLSGKYGSESIFSGVRSRWSPEIIRKRAALLDKIKFVTGGNTTLAMAALRFILSYPAVATVIPGVRSHAQLEENVSASAGSMPEDQVRRLEQLWQSEIRDQQLGW
ncbi:aldo/keto reductase [Paenibacillus sp. NFR01]|uniref:aldo/keto reductase n=1 Tax=Paenibacillus sp. NFR01 TaxID=1566279 RepID=UPI0008B316C3|nr:aldo/keto reductase [Paenibacillus sp. NFR01]SET55369.1 Predicted oxidoreductase [Paenibacillus sp. NFR01]